MNLNDCQMHGTSICEREHAAWRACSKRKGKPASYTWRLWTDPKAGRPKRVALGPIRPHPVLDRVRGL